LLGLLFSAVTGSTPGKYPLYLTPIQATATLTRSQSHGRISPTVKSSTKSQQTQNPTKFTQFPKRSTFLHQRKRMDTWFHSITKRRENGKTIKLSLSVLIVTVGCQSIQGVEWSFRPGMPVRGAESTLSLKLCTKIWQLQRDKKRNGKRSLVKALRE